MSYLTKILSAGLANPPHRYSQQEILQRLPFTNSKYDYLFKHPHIKFRHLILPHQGNQKVKEETNQSLQAKHKKYSVEVGFEAIMKCLNAYALEPEKIDYVCAVTSTGFLVPGLTTYLANRLRLKDNCQRLDIVGMGCHGGLNGLQAVYSWCSCNPNKYAILVCSEICSATYSLENNDNAALVNSLFADGAGALLVGSSAHQTEVDRMNEKPTLLGFCSHTISETTSALCFYWSEIKDRNTFYIDKRTPKMLAKSITKPLTDFLASYSLDIKSIKHWIVHTGGSAILDGISESLGLPSDSLAYTRKTLLEYGNLSSGSFIFTYDLISRLGKPEPNDFGIMITMGPGLTIEMALIRW